MIGRKETVVMAVIFAIFITTGLILSCGGEDGDGAGVSCEEVCERLEECEWIDNYDIEECVEFCEEELEQDDLECTMETNCEDIMEVCSGWDKPSCQDACERIDNCGLFPGEFGDTLEECLNGCVESMETNPEVTMEILECIMGTPCIDIYDHCE